MEEVEAEVGGKEVDEHAEQLSAAVRVVELHVRKVVRPALRALHHGRAVLLLLHHGVNGRPRPSVILPGMRRGRSVVPSILEGLCSYHARKQHELPPLARHIAPPMIDIQSEYRLPRRQRTGVLCPLLGGCSLFAEERARALRHAPDLMFQTVPTAARFRPSALSNLWFQLESSRFQNFNLK